MTDTTYRTVLTHLGPDDEPAEWTRAHAAPTVEHALEEARMAARQRAESLRTEITWALYHGPRLIDWDILGGADDDA